MEVVSVEKMINITKVIGRKDEGEKEGIRTLSQPMTQVEAGRN